MSGESPLQLVLHCGYHGQMKWLSLALGIVFVLISWFVLQIGKGVTFTYGGYEEWNDEYP